MPLAGFEPAIPASEQPQTRVLDRAATGISIKHYTGTKPKDRRDINENISTEEKLQKKSNIHVYYRFFSWWEKRQLSMTRDTS
jgi:hypothetical protein